MAVEFSRPVSGDELSAQRSAAFATQRMNAIGHLRSSVRIVRIEGSAAPYDWQEREPGLLTGPAAETSKPEPVPGALGGNMLLHLTALPEMLRPA